MNFTPSIPRRPIVYNLFLNDRVFGYVLNRLERAISLYIPVSLHNPILKLTNALNKFHDLSFKAKLEIFWLQLGASVLSICRFGYPGR